MTSSIYIHLDTTSNIVLTQGINAGDFHRGIVHPPKNILLLNPSSELGEFENHTTMKIIRGEAAVSQFLQNLSKNRLLLENKWIDFTDLAMLKELTPLEISELLYFGHMKTHLYSPFFYKLQNNFVYFDGLKSFYLNFTENTAHIRPFDYSIFWTYGFILALFGTVIPPILFNLGFPNAGLGLGSIISSLELPVSVTMAFMLLGEKVLLIQWGGIVLILMAIVLMNLPSKNEPQEAKAYH